MQERQVLLVVYSSVEPCHSSAALDVPIRDDRPPVSTITAELDILRILRAAASTQLVRRLIVGGAPLGSAHVHFPTKEPAPWATQ